MPPIQSLLIIFGFSITAGFISAVVLKKLVRLVYKIIIAFILLQAILFAILSYTGILNINLENLNPVGGNKTVTQTNTTAMNTSTQTPTTTQTPTPELVNTTLNATATNSTTSNTLVKGLSLPLLPVLSGFLIGFAVGLLRA